MMENVNEDCDDIKDDVKENINSLPDLIELVKSVQENPMLWNQMHPHFKNRDKKDMKWNFLGSCLTNQLNGDEAKKRFNNLRTTFGKLFKKVCDSEPRSEAGGDHKLFKPDWPLYEHMLFLRDVIRLRRSKTSGVRKIGETFMQPKISKRRKIIAKTHTAQPILNSTPLTNSTVQLKDNDCNSENNINTSQNLSQSLPSEQPVIIAEGICFQPYNLDENNIWTETTETDTESNNFVVTPTADKFYKKKNNEEILVKNMEDVVGVLKTLANYNTEALIIQLQPSISDHVLSPTAEALLVFVKASLNKVKEENLMNYFQDILSLFQKYIEK